LTPVRRESLVFTEFSGDPKEWVLEEVTFNQINLIVGRNSSGKSRLLNVVVSLANMLSGRVAKVLHSVTYSCVFSCGSKNYQYSINTKQGKVIEEKLFLNGNLLLNRGENGIGTIWAEQIGQTINFETPPDQMTACTRRDKIQHPFFEDLHTWASLLRHYQFGTPLGKDRLFLIDDAKVLAGDSAEISEASEVVKLYARAYDEFGKEFDRKILKDLKALGYDCTKVGAEDVDTSIIRFQGAPLIWLFVQERGLKSKTHQVNMSQGMFRALALVIHLNYCVLSKIPRTLLIDDIGEGLDFSRAQSFIGLLIEHSKQNHLQLIMTSNDRFVMNGVPLEHWGVMTRDKSTVRLVNERNSAQVFEDFKELGLNNFDFFSTDFFEDGLK
jgi:energy-coupling factor transporter ATP-binding protein EcfA2